jgi:hypothetical protein
MAPREIFTLVFAACCAGLLILFRKQLQEAIEQFNDRRGPPGPMHPLPSNDANLVSKRFRKRAAGDGAAK